MPKRLRGVGPWLFALGLALRLWALPSWGTFDTEVWKAWSHRAVTGGVADIYGPPDSVILESARKRGGSRLQALLSMPIPKTTFLWGSATYSVDYPPGSVLVLWAAGKLYEAYDAELPNRRAFNVAVNLAPFLCSLGIALLLYRSAPVELRWPRTLAFWLNPAVFLSAPLLGYLDTTFGFLGLAGVLALMRGRYASATALVVASGLVKPQGVLLLPVLIAVLLREAGWRALLRACLAGGGVAVLILAPWWSHGFLISALDGCRRPLGQDTLAPLGHNIWWVAGYVMDWAREGPWPVARIVSIHAFRDWAGWQPRLVSRMLLALATLASLGLLLNKPVQQRAMIPFAVILQVHAYALFGTSVHENHTFLAVILAPLLLGAWRSAGALVTGVSAFLFASLFLTAGLGRRITRLRTILALRATTVIDLSVLVALAHVVLVACLFRSAARSPGAGEAAPGTGEV